MREKVLLVCSECLSRNYTTTINTSNSSVKEFKKFCKHCGKVTVHKISK